MLTQLSSIETKEWGGGVETKQVGPIDARSHTLGLGLLL
jgi:hypothetical protein